MEQHPSFQLVDELLHRGGYVMWGKHSPADHGMGRPGRTVGMVTTLCMHARKKANVWKAVEPIMALD